VYVHIPLSCSLYIERLPSRTMSPPTPLTSLAVQDVLGSILHPSKGMGRSPVESLHILVQFSFRADLAIHNRGCRRTHYTVTKVVQTICPSKKRRSSTNAHFRRRSCHCYARVVGDIGRSSWSTSTADQRRRVNPYPSHLTSQTITAFDPRLLSNTLPTQTQTQLLCKPVLVSIHKSALGC